MRRRVAVPVLLAGAVALVASGCSRPPERPVGLDGRVLVRDFRFTPDSFVVRVGQQTSILLQNDDKVTHSFRSAVLGLEEPDRPGEKPGPRSVDIGPGASRRVNLTLSQSQADPEVVFDCRFHHFEGMAGTIRVIG